MEKFGISESVKKRRIKELTKENIPVIRKDKKRYSINLDVVNAMYLLNSVKWEAANKKATDTKQPLQTPIYVKDNVEHYRWDEEKQRIIKETTL